MQVRKHASFPRRTASDRWAYWIRLILPVALVAAITIAAVYLTRIADKPSASKSVQTRKSFKAPNSASTMQGSFRFEQVPIDQHGVLRYALMDDDAHKELSFEDWIRLVSEPGSSDLARNLTEVLKEAPYKAFRFETPGVSIDTVSETRFEFVLVEDTYLANFASTPDPEAFANYLSSPTCDSGDNTEHPPAGCVFANLGGDATLVAPRDWSPDSSPSMFSSSYGHLANFVRGAPEQQVLNLWNTVGKSLREKLLPSTPTPSSVETKTETSKPLWFSTAGDGVAWLHFRLDSRPKYYHYSPYKTFPKK